jgi:CTP:phosphocholine cytidylyltransferase-like protein
MNAIILCGGLSTRLGEITKNIPKILLDIKGKTVLDWQLEKLRAANLLIEFGSENFLRTKHNIFQGVMIFEEKIEIDIVFPFRSFADSIGFHRGER